MCKYPQNSTYKHLFGQYKTWTAVLINILYITVMIFSLQQATTNEELPSFNAVTSQRETNLEGKISFGGGVSQLMKDLRFIHAFQEHQKILLHYQAHIPHEW